ncbi:MULTISPECIES: ABC transporter permease [Myroides]|uniref:FtsX-like permease family protein n=1 Tax=Myroides albus TaxID=2562892 RepID=A0A6I3LM10_9FLAO|nr:MULTISPECIES: FtsX-like permease family protein [Myroides]MTG97025.1 FtsX-like permease family protein [Myroides albus]MVX35803.1 FtsX-like permease family protein [Myroides sp. LoEW2-1]UVD81300.1 ABC transporter permease [Myroides albus]
MKLEYFITKRLVTTKNHKSSISTPIIKIAITAIAMGIVMMLVSVATGLGLKYKIRDKISAFSGHVVITSYDNNATDITLKPLDADLSKYEAFNSVKDIKKIQSYASKAGIIRTESAFEGVVYKGVDSLYDLTEVEKYLTVGRLPKTQAAMSNEVLLSEYIANRLHLEVGDKITTYFMKEWGNKVPNVRQFEVVGIFNSGLQQFDENIVIGDIKHVQRLNRWKSNQVGGFEVIVKDFDKIEEIGAQIYLDLPSSVDSRTIVEKYNNVFGWIDMFDFNIMVIIIIMIVVASINMIVALLVLILERTQMIGILKALGANNWTVRKIFLYNACYLILKGLFYGNLIGLGLLYLQKFTGLVKLDASAYYVREAPVLIRLSDVLLLNIGVVIIALLVLLIPSYLITKISPVKAIRYD